MVFFSYALFPFLLFITLHIQKIQNKYYKFKYFNSALLAATGTSFLLFLNFENLTLENFQFLKDYKFYIAQAFSIFFIIIQIKIRKYNEENLTICYFVNFLSIAIIPFVSIFLMYIFEFKNTLEIEYKSFYHVIGLSASLFILSTLFYIDKLRNKSIKKVNWLITAFIIGSFATVFSSKLMQEYDPTNYMIVATIINFIAFITIFSAKEAKDYFELKKSLILNKNSYFIMAGFYCISLNINIFIISNIPAEYYSIIRNVGIILMNYFYSYYYENVNLINLKDSFILFIIIAVLAFFTMN